MIVVTSLFVIASADGTLFQSVFIPVVVAGLTAAATLLVSRAGDAANRRRDRYAQAVETLVAWVEFPYRVRRRTDDDPSTLACLTNLGHDLQERLSCHQAWIATESPRVASAYERCRTTLSRYVGPALIEAWNSPPVETAAGMNLGQWGPARNCAQAITAFQGHVETRFGLRRLKQGPVVEG